MTSVQSVRVSLFVIVIKWGCCLCNITRGDIQHKAKTNAVLESALLPKCCITHAI